jgi:hypothetical protein
MARRFVYDYYLVDLPGDLDITYRQMSDHAIYEARERTRLYCTPAVWSAVRIRGQFGDNTITFKVCRKRNKKVA